MEVEELPVSEKRKAFYTRVYRQCFSPDGNWLVASDSRSRLCVFSVVAALSQEAFSVPTRSLSCYINLERSVFALHRFENVLICGDSRGGLYAYHWANLKSPAPTSINPKKIFEVNHYVSAGSESGIPSEINAVTSIDKKILYGGAGNNAVHLVDPERPEKVVSSFHGHKDYINEIKARSSNEFLSASEDGSVCIWDLRMANVVHTLFVCDEPQLRCPKSGKGVCALDVRGSFMVCGGDVIASLWQLDSRSLATVLACKDSDNMRFTTAKMVDDRILIGGTCPQLYQFDYSGKEIISVTVTPNSIYSIEPNVANGPPLTTVAGGSQFIDAFLNLGYISFAFDTSFEQSAK